MPDDQGVPLKFTATVRLSALLAPDDPNSEWLLRLMIVRDDMAHEFFSMRLSQRSTPSDVWRHTYFLRRITISITECRHILMAQYVDHAITRSRSEEMRAMEPHYQQAKKLVDKAYKTLLPIRNSIGGHAEFKESVLGKNAVARVLQNTLGMGGRVFYDAQRPAKTSFRELSLHSILFASPEDAESEGIGPRLGSIVETIQAIVPEALEAMESLIVCHGLAVGVFKPRGVMILDAKKERYGRLSTSKLPRQQRPRKTTPKSR